MTLESLYQIIEQEITDDHILELDSALAEGVYWRLMWKLGVSGVTVRNCTVAKTAETVTIAGTIQMQQSLYFDAGSIQIVTTRAEADGLSSQMIIRLTGEYAPDILFGQLAPYVTSGGASEESLFAGIVLDSPVLEAENGQDAVTVTGLSYPPEYGQRWRDYQYYLDNKMYVKGTYKANSVYYPILRLAFQVNRKVALPIGAGTGNLVIDTVDNLRFYASGQVTTAYMEYTIAVERLQQTLAFRMPLFTGRGTGQFSVYCDPSLSVPDIMGVLKNILQIPDQLQFMPQNAFLSSFGLRQLDLVYQEDAANQYKASGMKAVRGIFSLGRPLELFVPNLLLERFQLAWEISRWTGDGAVVTLFLAAGASVTLGSLIFQGNVTAYYPQMEFEGSFTLAEQVTLQELARECHAALPDFWTEDSNEIAELIVTADGIRRSMSLHLTVKDILRLKINDKLSFQLEEITAQIRYASGQMGFAISGTLGFQYGQGNAFAFLLAAEYEDQDWRFEGTLAYGTVNLGELLASALGVTVEDNRTFDISLQDFSVSYVTGTQEFLLYASCEVWFEILGIRTDLGGRVRLRQIGENREAALAAYLNIDKLRLQILAQADNIYAADKKYVFRIAVMEKYLEAIYEKKESGTETLSLMLGGITVGDIVLAMIHLLNPNARNTLSSPWDMLHKISLSSFVLTLDLTNKKLYFLYQANLNLAGIMKIDQVGLSYDGSSVEYLLTGECLGQKYTTEDPFCWDAMNGQPQDNMLPNETKMHLHYFGIGNHLDLELTGDTLPEMLEDMKTKLDPDKQGFSYGTGGWMIASDFELSSLFRVKLLLYDPKIYGLIIEFDMSEESSGSALKFLDGLSLELFYKKISDETGMFHCRLTLPAKYSELDLGAVSIHLGEILVEVYTNGSFYVDLGFPHDRDFSRSWGLSVGIYSGKGGIYLGVFKGDAVNSVPEITNGAFSPVIKLGIGLSVGLEKSFDLGVIKAGISLTLIGIFEGIFAVFQPQRQEEDKALYYKVSATVGVVGTLFVNVDFKIIAIKASAEIKAYCLLELESCRRALVSLELELRLSAYIKILFFKISFSVHFQQTAEFYIGSDSRTPWTLKESPEPRGNLYLRQPVLPKLASLTRKISVAPLVMPLCSRAEAGRDGVYCMAFPVFLRQEDFADIVGLMTELLYGAQGDDVRAEDAFALMHAGLEENIDYDFVLKLFARCIQVNIALSVGEETQEEENSGGVVFPMLPQLGLSVNGETTDFGALTAGEDYIEKLNAYFEKTNADSTAESDRIFQESEEIPVCGILLTDWVKMIVRELTGRVGRMFRSFETVCGGIHEAVECYGVQVRDLLEYNPHMNLHITSLPSVKLTIEKGDTLSGLAQTAGTEALWQAASHVYGLTIDNIVLHLEEYEFDNREAGLSIREAAALFFLRLFDVEVIYTAYAEEIIGCAENQKQFDMQWRCTRAGDAEILLPDGRRRITLAGDTVAGIARECAILNGEYAGADWTDFLNRFMRLNEGRQDTYRLFGQYTLSGYSGSLLELFCRCFPDFKDDPNAYPLWQEPILRPSMVIYPENIPVSKGNHSQRASHLTGGYGKDALIGAVSEGTADLNGSQRLRIYRPSKIPGAIIRERLLAEETVSEIAAVISRAFLQGARLPAVEGQEDSLLPMYEVLGQQIVLPDEPQDYSLRMFKIGDVEWINVNTEEALLTAETIASWLPQDIPDEQWSLEQIAPFAEGMQSFNMTEGYKTNDGTERKYLGILPSPACDYLECYEEALTVERDGKAPDALQWAVLLSLRLYREEKGVYCVVGVKADEADRLYGLTQADELSFAFYCMNTGSGSESESLIPLNAEGCTLIKTNLSKETHYISERRGQEGGDYVADIKEGVAFAGLLWECTVIGGGYWLHLPADDIADFVWNEEGFGEIMAVIVPDDAHISLANALYMTEEPQGTVLYGPKEKVQYPTMPAGCVGFTLERRFANENRYQSLFQLMGYQVETDGRESYESVPLMPAESEADAEKVRYRFVCPVWKLCGDNVYAGVGQRVSFRFFLRDVLGNTRMVTEQITGGGALTVEAGYNDFLIGLNELPQTKWSYGFAQTADGGRQIRIVCRAAENRAGSREAEELALLQKAILQWESVSIKCSFSLTDTVNISGDSMERIREYADALYQYLIGETAEAPRIELTVSIEGSNSEEEIRLLKLLLTISREGSGAAEEIAVEALEAAAEILPSEEGDFAEGFERVCDAYKIAYDDQNRPTAVSREIFGNFDPSNFAVAPYEITVGETTFFSPEYYALTPMALALVTRKVQISDAEGYTFTDADVNQWERQFLADVETFLAGSVICAVLDSCGEKEEGGEWINRLIRVKAVLAEELVDRIHAVRKDAKMQTAGELTDIALERFRRDLNLAYETSVIAVFQGVWKKQEKEEAYRLEPEAVGDAVLCASKLKNSENGNAPLCLFLKETEDPFDKISLSYPYLEYHITTGMEGYDRSGWLRFETPVSQNIDLRHELHTPFPKKECPTPPGLLEQMNGTEGEALLRYRWKMRMAAQVCAQDVLYLRLTYGELEKVAASGEDRIDVLARYQLERNRIMEMLEQEDQICEAFQCFTQYAEDYIAKPVTQSTKLLPADREKVSETSVLIRLGFAYAGEEIEITVLNQGEVEEQMSALGAVLHVDDKGRTAADGNTVEWDVTIENLPVYQCYWIKPEAYIVRNNDLFRNPKVQVDDRFIFCTETVELNRLYISADYKETFLIEKESLTEAVAAVWETLALDSTITRLNMTVFYEYPVNARNRSVMARLPVTFMTDVREKEEIVDNILAWEEPKRTGGRWIMETQVFRQEADSLVVRACFAIICS